MLHYASVIVLVILAGCGGATAPSQDDRVAVYSGQWQAVIGDVHVVVEIHAVPGWAAPYLEGTGTAVNRTTGETHKLKILGNGMMADEMNSFFNISLADETTEHGLRLGARIGQFTGHLASGRRSWVGLYRAWSSFPDFVDIFGVQEVLVTFNKG